MLQPRCLLRPLTCAFWEIKAHAARSWPPAIAKWRAVCPCESRWSMSSNADFFRPSKLTNYHCCGCEIILDEKIEIFKILEKYGKQHDSNPNLCHCTSRSGIVKNEKLSSISIRQVLVDLRIGQGSASYCKKIFTRAAFPFFAAWCRTGSRSPFKSFFLRSLGAKIHTDFQDGWMYSTSYNKSFEEVSALPKLGTNLIN